MKKARRKIDAALKAKIALELAAVEHHGRAFCVDARDEALASFGRPRILNTDQGSQFTSAAFTSRLAGAEILISMDGRGRWLDNVFIERLWRSMKDENVDLRGYACGRDRRVDRLLQCPMSASSAGRPNPMAVWRQGHRRPSPGNEVDMTLRLDDADPLPTCPPRRPQQYRRLA